MANEVESKPEDSITIKAQALGKLQEIEFDRLLRQAELAAESTCSCSCPRGGAGAGAVAK